MGARWTAIGFGLGMVTLATAAVAEDAATVEPVIVTARLRPENAQSIPTSLSVVDADQLAAARTESVAQIAQLVPSLNYVSPNPRNTAFTIRGLGSSVIAVSQANDGLDPGVGIYVDQVYQARPATAAFDLPDLERVEVLRGPQGTVFGRNTAAGALNITTRAPTFTPEATAEISLGDLNYRQGKLTLSGPLIPDQIAGRFSLMTARRDGNLRNVTTGGRNNDVDTLALRARLLVRVGADVDLTVSGDYGRLNSNCCTQVFVGVGTTLKSEARRYYALAAGVGYAPPSLNPYDRMTDIDAGLKVDTNQGGVSAIAQWRLPDAVVTSVSAWRQWNWDAANDRDYTRLSIQTVQHIPSRQNQYSQEIRIASPGRRNLEYVTGLYAFTQIQIGRPVTRYGPLATYWLLGPSPAFPANLLDGYTTDGRTRLESHAYAAFGEVIWRLSDAVSLTGGLRYTHEDKAGTFASTVSGGATPTSSALLNSKLSILRPQSYRASVSDHDLSGRLMATWDMSPRVMLYASYAVAGKSGGVNMSGLPLDAANQPALNTAVIRPEKNAAWEIGIKSRLMDDQLVLNLVAFQTTIRDFQTNVVDNGPGALRGYLANIERVRVEGVELDSRARLTSHLTVQTAASWTEGRYLRYRNGPCPLERIGSAITVCDLSGRPLSALPKLAWSIGADYARPLEPDLSFFIHADALGRSGVFGDPTDSRYTWLPGYTVVNARIGLRKTSGLEISIWARNLFQAQYLQNVTVQAGNSGLIVGTPGDPRSLGMTLRASY
ncbi:MAG: TonB-dependent receptor [Phenylobacterium zucineum]|nr:MAG: TonB-dependent receptor [Phenylobacterium zucineum]